MQQHGHKLNYNFDRILVVTFLYESIKQYSVITFIIIYILIEEVLGKYFESKLLLSHMIDVYLLSESCILICLTLCYFIKGNLWNLRNFRIHNQYQSSPFKTPTN